jgi:hypothetical protein
LSELVSLFGVGDTESVQVLEETDEQDEILMNVIYT